MPLSGTSGYTAAGLIQPVAIALDAAGNVFTANSNSTVTKLNTAGTSIALFQSGGLNMPYAVAVDSSQNVWLANYGDHGSGNSVSKFSNAGTPAAGAGYTGGGMAGPFGIAIDATGNAWVANFNNASVSKLSSTGTPLSGAGYATPAEVGAIAVDGNNTVWTANADGSISHLSSSGASISPASTGYISSAATAEVGIALDASGNVWTTDNDVNSIFEYIGVAAPTVTPFQLAVKNKTIGRRP
jgi:streptogramin lyase